jgi:hypothetical protein
LKVNNGVQFWALEPLKTVGEEAPFYRARKLHVTEFLGCSGAEPGVASGCTLNRVQRLCLARSNSGSYSRFPK